MAQLKRPQRDSQRTLLNCIDHLGRPIEASVFSVAQESAPQAVSYAQKFLADPLRCGKPS